MITVEHLTGNEWQVTVKTGVTTHHRVRVTPAELERFAAGRSAEDLLQESFRFLLEREPNTSILASFDLSVINHYFPAYEEEIRKRLSGRG
jgi:hypothetical protein